MDRVAYIEGIANGQESFESSGFINAFVRCLSFDETVEVLRRSLEGTVILRAPALRKTCAEIHLESSKGADLVAELKKKILAGNPRRRSAYAYCLLEIARVGGGKTREEVQAFLSSSKYVGLRRRGYKLYDPECSFSRELLEQSWNQFEDWEAAWLIVKTFPAAYLLRNKSALVAALSEGWQLSKLYLRLAEIDAGHTDELLEIDAISFLYVQAKLGRYVSDDQITAICLNHLGDERVGLLLWCLGELKHWNHLVALSERRGEMAKLRFSEVIRRESDN